MASDPAPQVSDAELTRRFRDSVNKPASSQLMGFELVSLSQADMRVEALFTADPQFANPMGQIQGGFLCVMLDEVMSVAGLVASNMTCVMPTLEMKTSFLRPAPLSGQIRGIGRVLKWGRTIAFTEGELFGADGKLIAKATGTAMPTPFAKFKPTT